MSTTCCCQCGDPNAETFQVMAEAEAGDLVTAGTVAALSLGAGLSLSYLSSFRGPPQSMHLDIVTCCPFIFFDSYV